MCPGDRMRTKSKLQKYFRKMPQGSTVYMVKPAEYPERRENHKPPGRGKASCWNGIQGSLGGASREEAASHSDPEPGTYNSRSAAGPE